ncbi:MAG TPA: hypothetical protein VMY05_12660 [Acidobacteriota bacterium]|nr:hypothetical protein [Acidobacteriota bacterium]
MAGNRVIYQNWIADTGRGRRRDRSGSRSGLDDRTLTPAQAAADRERRDLIGREVARALLALTDDEREFIERFYFAGQSYASVRESSGRDVHKLEALHKRALRKLRKELAPLVARLYHLHRAPEADCVICNSPFRPQIDLLIRYRDKSGTWKDIIGTLRSRYGIRIGTPQILIGHEKYH